MVRRLSRVVGSVAGFVVAAVVVGWREPCPVDPPRCGGAGGNDGAGDGGQPGESDEAVEESGTEGGHRCTALLPLKNRFWRSRNFW